MPAQHVIRKLAAIRTADVNGYSLLMRDNEAWAVQTLRPYKGVMVTQAKGLFLHVLMVMKDHACKDKK